MLNQTTPPQRGYTIAAVSKLTGISCHALRAWERRYGFPVPGRSQSGHRRYDDLQVQLLRRISAEVRQGESISHLIAELNAGQLAPAPEPPPGPDRPTAQVGLLNSLLEGDLVAAERTYDRALGTSASAEVAARLIEPALVELGERWFRGECAVEQERIASGFLLTKLRCMLAQAVRANPQPAHAALLCTMTGEHHEGGALLFALMLELSGWRALVVGPELPVANLESAVRRFRPEAIGVSFVLSRNINKRFDELSRVRSVPVFVGGRSILNYQGLARRHGLIPMPGPACDVVGPMLQELDRREHAG
jgi:DNA-binding transcriptional MerR regulator